MKELRFTLLSDGSSDRALIPVLKWLLRQHVPRLPLRGEWADLRRLPRPPKSLADRLASAVNLFPCELLFVHRDAERSPRHERVEEIESAVEACASFSLPPVIPVVPVRMTEAWLLFDEQAIRLAAGNPNGHQALKVPKLRDLESNPDPKQTLHELLKQASGLCGRRLRQFPFDQRVTRVAEFIRDFTPLRQLKAFASLEKELPLRLRGFPQPALDNPGRVLDSR